MLRYYRVTDPLGLSWRKFVVLLRGLPADSAFLATVRHQREWSTKNPLALIDKIKQHRRLGLM